MDLFILRHGEADKSSDGDDFIRPLTVEGATDVTCVAEWLKDLGVKFGAIDTKVYQNSTLSIAFTSDITISF